MNLPLVLFDLGGVLVDIRYRAFLESLKLDHVIDEQELLRRLTPDGHLYERGTITTDDFFKRLKKALGVSATDYELHEAWYSILAEEIEGMREIVEQAAQQTKTYLLSNTNELHFDFAVQKFPVLCHFRDYFVSYKIGAMKPSHEIYHHVVKSLGTRSEELLFIDDLEQNVRGAQEVGIRGILFAGVESLKKRLQKIGFKIK